MKKEEIFGPIMPILAYDSLDEVIQLLAEKPKPLALYFFSEDKQRIRKVTEQCSYGGGCINDTIIHLATSEMGFGGVGESGMGSYHGKEGFEAFSHTKSIVDKKTWNIHQNHIRLWEDTEEKSGQMSKDSLS